MPEACSDASDVENRDPLACFLIHECLSLNWDTLSFCFLLVGYCGIMFLCMNDFCLYRLS